MKILVVSGFLGAGKTTFIRELLARTDIRPAILENEYGEVDLDSTDLQKNADQKILEFMEGCVCCTKKDVFTNSLIAISASLDPEYLVIEPTGVARLGSLLKSIQVVEWDRIRLMRPIVIVCPASYFANMQDYPDICESQIRDSGIIVFSKIENESPELIARVSAHIRTLNPDADILNTPYQQQDRSWFNALFENPFSPGDAAAPADTGTPSREADEEIDEFTLKNVCLRTPGELVSILEETLHGRNGAVVRAKGVLRIGGEWFRYDLADGRYAIIQEFPDVPAETPAQAPAPKTQCVFIGRSIDRERLQHSFAAIPQERPKKQKISYR